MNKESLSKEVIEQYEYIRASGVTNMFDYYNVVSIAGQFDMDSLAELTKDEYAHLLQNYSRLMEKYNIKQK